MTTIDTLAAAHAADAGWGSGGSGMSAFKGTPGPWAVNPVSAQVDAMPSLLPVCQLLWPTDQRSEAETEANARLIAAAPDLLSELEYARTTLSLLRTDVARSAKVDPRWEGMDENFAEWLGRIDSAIAKATGEQP